MRPFRVLQWNVLAEGLAEHGDFVRVDPATLLWAARFPAVVRIIDNLKPDVFGVEELNRYEDLKAALPDFDSLFFPKPASPAVRFGGSEDGVALFVRRSAFTICAHRAACYSNPDRRGTGNQGFIAAALQPTGGGDGSVVVVGVTHLKAKRGFDELRSHQVSELLSEVTQLADRVHSAK